MNKKRVTSHTQTRNDMLTKTYNFLMTHIAKHGHAPSISQMVKELGYARQTVINYLKHLQEAGWIERPYWRHGAIKLTRPTEVGLTPEQLQTLIGQGKPKRTIIRWFKKQ